MEFIFLSMRNSVSSLSEARCRYVKSSCPSRKRSYSSGIGSLTFTIKPALSKTSSALPAMLAPASAYSSSSKPAPTPAPSSTTTSCPRCTSSATPSGCIETRISPSLISLGTPTTVAIGPLLPTSLSSLSEPFTHKGFIRDPRERYTGGNGGTLPPVRLARRASVAKTRAPERVAPGVYRADAVGFPNAVSVLLLENDDGWTLVDTGLGSSVRRIRDALAALGAEPR